MTTVEIVNKLVGKINPVGETTQDNDRLENLEDMCTLVGELLKQIYVVYTTGKDSYEHSVKKASDHAKNFLKNDIGLTTWF